jgi:hypothetical protein
LGLVSEKIVERVTLARQEEEDRRSRKEVNTAVLLRMIQEKRTISSVDKDERELYICVLMLLYMCVCLSLYSVLILLYMCVSLSLYIKSAEDTDRIKNK